MKYVVGLAGTIGSGKTVVSRHIHEKYGAGQMRFSRILMDVLDRLYLPHERKNLQKLGASLRESLGEDVVVNAFRRDLEKDESEVTVIDGIRYMNEVWMLRGFTNNILLYINAPAKLRYERCRMRGEKGEDKIGFDEFLAAEERETERWIPEVEKAADYRLKNAGPVEELLERVDKILVDEVGLTEK